jgi:hypothetical protein
VTILFFILLLAADGTASPRKDPLDAYSDCVIRHAMRNASQNDPELVAERALVACRSLRTSAAKTFLKNRRRMGHWEFDLEMSGVAVDAVAVSRIPVSQEDSESKNAPNN